VRAESIARALRACSVGLAGSGARFGRADALTAGRAHRRDHLRGRWRPR